MFKKHILSGGKCYCLFLLFLFFIPAYSNAQQCDIDYNKSTIAAGAGHAAGLKEDGTVVATVGTGMVRLMFLHGQI